MIASLSMIAAADFAFESWGPMLRIAALAIIFLIVVVGLAFVVIVASLPGVIAGRRNHPQAGAIRVCGWVGLPTGVLWAIAMTWAFWNYDEPNLPSSSASLDSTGPQMDELRQQIENLEQLVGQLEKSKG